MLERQFPTSVIISWSHPNTSRTSMIREYKIYVNGVPKTTVQGKVKTMLLDSIDQDMTYRISVRTLTAEGMSDEAACTIMIGKGASASPTRLKASHVTPDSADITWLPGNSNHSHVISVNGREMITVKPGRHQYSFAGLSPSSVYRVRVTAKPKHTTNDNLKKHSAEIEFKTLPGDMMKSGLPEPPLDVQIKPGSLPGTLEVEWLPVTITTSGLSNGAVVMGYAVFANEYKVASTPSPTVDRLVLHIDKLRALGATHLVVRTLSPNGFSADSSKVRLPQHLLQTSTPLTTQQSEIIRFLYSPSVRVSRYRKRYQPHHFWCKYRGNARSNMYENASDDDSQSSRTTSEDSHPEVFAKNGAVKMVNTPQTSNDVKKKSDLEYQSESDRSELSDIAEEAEEELSDFESGDLPGLSDSIEKSWQDEQFKNVKETLEHNAKLESEFDETDPEVEQLNKPNHAVPIQIIRQQRDYERESDLSPHNQVLEPVPVKPKQTDLQISVPQIDPEELYDDSTVRTFVALYDYDPESMSPNDDGVDEELAFHEGDLIKIYGDKDADGFYIGELNGKRGFVPYNMVQETQTNSEEPHTKPPRNQSSEPTTGELIRTDTNSTPQEYQSPVNGHQSSSSQKEVERCMLMRAIFDYDPSVSSPNPDIENELSFQQGELITVYGDMDEDGFFMGEANGERGLVPSNFLEEASDPGLNGSAGSPAPSTGGYSLNSFDRSPTTKDSQQDLGRQSSIGSTVSKQSNGFDQVSQTSMDDPKKKKGLLSKGKALFKKFGGGDSGNKKKK
ncbi:RIMS-binding protein 2-like isoform X6 [Anneissia japonica]|uniref:RIMS-binding protein 2-like isoform X6 n=1 Tax=Anneissia japonica TaxID=1529436 RepID=UPI0014256847|nr:RIMS-binding protein 2-like isoform X6 [Anneissia japonica]